MHGLEQIKENNTTYTYSITIGSNVEDRPTSYHKWLSYQVSLLPIINKYASDLHTEANGTGFYKGISEEAYIIVFSMIAGFENQLIKDLKPLAVKYDQESIAMVKGLTTFIEGIKS